MIFKLSAEENLVVNNNIIAGGAVASWLVRSSPKPAVRVRALSPGRGHCVVFLGKTLNSHSAPFHPGV